MPAGAWLANLGATRQALAPVVGKGGRYFGLSINERSPSPALVEGSHILQGEIGIDAVGELGVGRGGDGT